MAGSVASVAAGGRVVGSAVVSLSPAGGAHGSDDRDDVGSFGGGEEFDDGPVSGCVAVAGLVVEEVEQFAGSLSALREPMVVVHPVERHTITVSFTTWSPGDAAGGSLMSVKSPAPSHRTAVRSFLMTTHG